MKKLLFLLLFPCAVHAAEIHVTTLAGTGAGSLRACMEGTGTRECVIDVAGYIDLATPIIVSSPNLTVRGETAKAGGIHVRGARLEIKGDNTTLRHFSVRPGDGPGQAPSQRDAVVIWGADNVTLDHMSLTHAIDENLSTYQSVQNLKVTNCLIANSLNRSIHGENEMKAGVYIGHAMGALLDASGSSLWNKNLFANNLDRNIRVKQGNQIEFVNNYVFNWGRFSGSNLFNMDIGASMTLNKIHFIGNYYKRGASAINDHPCIYNGPGVPAGTKIYEHSNICPAGRTTDLVTEQNQIFAPQVSSITQPELLLTELVATVGARPWDRFPMDAEIINEVIGGVGSLKDCITQCGTNPDGTVDIPTGPWPVIGSGGATPVPTIAVSPTITPTPAGPTATPTIAPTVALCWAEVPCLSLTPTAAPTATPTATKTSTPLPATATPTATATRTPTNTATPLPPGVCAQKLAACAAKSEECSRYLANRIGARPYDAGLPCETHLRICLELDSECSKWIK